MHPMIRTRIELNHTDRKVLPLRRSAVGAGIPASQTVNLLIISPTDVAGRDIKRLLAMTDLFDIRTVRATDPSFAAKKMASPDIDIAIIVTSGWNKRALNRISKIPLEGRQCPLIIAARQVPDNLHWPLDSPFLFDMDNPNPDQLEATIINALYTRTIERQLFEATIELQKARTKKNRFLAHMSHDLKTPLNAIIGFSDAINLGIYGKPPTRKDCEKIQKINAVGTRLLATINTMIDAGTRCNDAPAPDPARGRSGQTPVS